MKLARTVPTLAVLLAVPACAARTGGPITNPAMSLASPGPRTPVDVTTQHNDSYRTGASLNEKRLTPDALRKGRFERLFEWDVDGQIYGQPLYLSRVPYGNRTINMVIVATMNNGVYAYEAPPAESDSLQPPDEKPLWYVDKSVLGEPLPFNYFSMAWGILGHNIEPLIGITSTPVVDRENATVYVTAKSGSGGFLGLFKSASYRLFAINLMSGEVRASVPIEATVRSPDGSQFVLDARHHLQRPGLLLASGRVYLGFGSHQDTPPYHGWLLAYRACTHDGCNLEQERAYCTTCGSKQSTLGGIWQAGGGPVADDAGNVYVMTGNGTFAADGADRGTSFLKLDPQLTPVGSWTPATHECLNLTDSDLGSAGPLLVKRGTTSTLVGGGKEGLLYALQPEALAGTHVGAGHAAGIQYPCYSAGDPTPDASGPGYASIQAAPPWEYSGVMDLLRHFEPGVLSQGFHHIHGSPVVWTAHDPQAGDRTLLYVSAERDLLRAYAFDGRSFPDAKAPDPKAPDARPTDTFHSRCPNSAHGMPGGFLTVSADGADPSSGIVWASMPRRDKDALHHIVPGVLRAYRAYPTAGSPILEELWNSDNALAVSTHEDCSDDPPQSGSEVGLFAKYSAPTVAEGKVYLPTFSGKIAVYGLRSERPGVAAPGAAYDARLAVASLPRVSEPRGSVPISIVATNTGTAPWQKGDVRLGSRKISGDGAVAIEGDDAMRLQRDVPPGQSYTFSFHVRVPEREGTYYYGWRLRHEDGKAGERWFGGETPEWEFDALRPDCADLRQRAAAVLRLVEPGKLLPLTQQEEVAAIRKAAESRDCYLDLASSMPHH